MNISKQKQQQLIIVGIVTGVVIAGLCYYGLSVQRGDIKVISNKIVEAQKTLDAAQARNKTEDVVSEHLASVTNELASIESDMAPANDKYSWFLRLLQKFTLPYANQINIPFKSREAVDDVRMFPAFGYRQAVFSLRGDANYHNLGHFISDLENKYPYFRVQRLVLSPAPSEATETPERLGFELDIVSLVNTNSP